MKKGRNKALAVLLSGVLVFALASPALASGRFSDVPETAWYAPAVGYAEENELFLGGGDGKFHPDSSMSRAMLAQVLARNTAGYRQEDWAGASGFTDVDQARWYAEPVKWAVTSGVANGEGNNRFRPDRPVTREETAVMLYRYAQRTGNRIVCTVDAGKKFKDAGQVSPWAADAVDWAASNGILQGYPDGTLRPNRAVSRAEAACMLYASARVLESTKVLYPVGTPLPEEIGWSGAGRDMWKLNAYLCKDLDELKGVGTDFLTEAPEGITGLPVYRDKYPSDEYETTEEMKAGYRKRVEDFLTAVGRGDLVEAGLTPNSYLWNESDTPSFSCDFPEFKVSAMARGMTLGLKLPGVKEMGTEELKTLLAENVFLAEACRYAGIDNPAFASRQDYTFIGDGSRKLFYIYQDCEDAGQAAFNRALAPMFLSVETDDSTAVGVTAPDAMEYAGDYVLLPYNEALKQLEEEKGIKSQDVLGYKLEYDNMITAYYYMPHYKFYYDITGSRPYALPEGFREYGEYAVRAVKD